MPIDICDINRQDIPVTIVIDMASHLASMQSRQQKSDSDCLQAQCIVSLLSHLQLQ